VTRDEFLRQAAALHREWTARVADTVRARSADQRVGLPAGTPTDYPEHHHDISAKPQLEADYHAALQALIRNYRRTGRRG